MRGMMYSLPNNNADDCEEINEACSEIDMLLCARESHVRFAQGPLHGSAEPTNREISRAMAMKAPIFEKTTGTATTVRITTA